MYKNILKAKRKWRAYNLQFWLWSQRLNAIPIAVNLYYKSMYIMCDYISKTITHIPTQRQIHWHTKPYSKLDHDREAKNIQ